MKIYGAPLAPPWSRHDTERDGDGFAVRVLKFQRADARLVLAAKDYAVGADEPDLLERRDWHEHYAPIIGPGAHIQAVPVQQTLIDRVVAGWQVTVEGTSRDSPVRIQERYAHVPGHRLIVSAIGEPAAFERFSRDIDRWFDGVIFHPGMGSR